MREMHVIILCCIVCLAIGLLLAAGLGLQQGLIIAISAFALICIAMLFKIR